MININNTLKLLGFEDLNIKELKIDESLTEFHIYVLLGKEKHKCPQCQTMNDSLHSYYEIIINHKHFVGKNCFIHFKRKRFKCLKFKRTFLESNPFAKMQTKISDETVFSVLRGLKQNQLFADVTKKEGILLGYTFLFCNKFLKPFINILPIVPFLFWPNTTNYFLNI